MKQKFPLIYFTVLVALLTIGLAILPSHSGHYMKYEMRRGFDQDPSCVLNLKFYQQGAESTRIIDHSGNNNHGTITGAVPATYPLLSGVELVTNGGMEVGNPPTGWEIYGTPTTFERSGTEKYIGSYSAHVVCDAQYEGFRLSILFNVVAGKKYRVSAMINLIAGQVRLDNWSGKLPDYVLDITTASGQFALAEGIFTATATGTEGIRFNNINVGAAEFYVDCVSIQEVTGYEVLGWYFNASTSDISIPNFTCPDIFTLITWIRPNYGRDPDGMVIVAGSHPTFILQFDEDGLGMADSPGGIDFYPNSGGGMGAFGPTNIAKDTWNCVALTWDYTTTSGTIYINGVIPSTGTLTIAGANPGKINPLRIGNYGGGSRFYLGEQGETLIFNRALSAQEIRNYFELTRHRYGVDARDILAEHAEEFEYVMAA